MSSEETGVITDPIDINKITEALPHRYPFLLIDRVTSYLPGKWLSAIKNVTINEPFFQGHFPGHPVMPGVLILEALAQASGMLAQLSNANGPNPDPLYYLVKIDKARFTQVVVPGDQLVLHVEQKRFMRNMGLYVCKASVDGKVVASAEMLCAEKSASK